MRDIEFGNRLKYLRKSATENEKYTQIEEARDIGVGYKSLQNHEAGHIPNKANVKKYLDFYGCKKVWLLAGEDEPFPGEEIGFKGQIREEPVVEYEKRDDPFGRASSGLREIFNSKDQALIAAIQVNIQAFQIAVQRDRQIQQQSIEIDKLKKECEELKKRIVSLEEQRDVTDTGPAAEDAIEKKET